MCQKKDSLSYHNLVGCACYATSVKKMLSVQLPSVILLTTKASSNWFRGVWSYIQFSAVFENVKNFMKSIKSKRLNEHSVGVILLHGYYNSHRVKATKEFQQQFKFWDIQSLVQMWFNLTSSSSMSSKNRCVNNGLK